MLQISATQLAELLSGILGQRLAELVEVQQPKAAASPPPASAAGNDG